jgi:hypothetical protein
MGQFEYLLLFASVILGLAVSDIAISLNRLIAAGAKVRWDWLAPMAAVVAFLKIITQWWSWFAAEPLAKGLTFGMFVGVCVSAVLLFLLAAAALPEELDEAAVDLRGYYAQVSRRYWLLFAAHFAASNIVSIWVQVSLQHSKIAFSPLYLIAPAAIALAFIRNRLLHGLCLVALTVTYLAQFADRGLGQ